MNDPRLEAMGDTPGSDVCGCTRVMLRLHEPAKGPLVCDTCGRFVSVARAKFSHEHGDYGSVLSTEVICPRCVGAA